MKKIFLLTTVALMALMAVGVGVAFAQGSQPPTPGNYGWMHEYVEQALAARLGLTQSQVEEQFASGKTLIQIALDHGIKQDDLANFMNDVHKDAFDKAVKDGVLSQQQADSMLQRMQTMTQNRYGPGSCPMRRGQGAGFGSGMMRNRGAGMMGGWWQGTQTP
jgi:hypothetical protein